MSSVGCPGAPRFSEAKGGGRTVRPASRESKVTRSRVSPPPRPSERDGAPCALSRHFIRIGITTSRPGLPQGPSIGLRPCKRLFPSRAREEAIRFACRNRSLAVTVWFACGNRSLTVTVRFTCGNRSLTVAARSVATLLKHPLRPTVSGLQRLCCIGHPRARKALGRALLDNVQGA